MTEKERRLCAEVKRLREELKRRRKTSRSRDRARKGAPACWYCGDAVLTRGAVWHHPDSEMESPMCELHDATTRAALALRAAGLDEAATALGDAVGIDTRPRQCQWIDPKG